MRIAIGSTNEVKVSALREATRLYAMFAHTLVQAKDVPSGVSPQPRSLKETVEGAINRAKAVYEGYDYGFGIESGLMEVPYTKTGMMDVCVCAIYDGKECSIGLSSAFECPPKVMEFVHHEGLDLNQAFYKAGMTQNTKLGSAGGAVGLLTRARVTRKDYTKQAITMAMVQLELACYYNSNSV